MSCAIGLLLLLAPDPVDELRDVLSKHAKLPYDQYEREKAIRELGRIGSAASTRALESMLADPFVHLRDAAVTALIQLKRKTAAERQEPLALLGDFLKRRSNAETRRHLATALGLIGDRRAVPALMTALGKERDASVVGALAEALARLEDVRAADPLKAKAQGFAKGRAACLRALGAFPYAVELAQAYLDDPDDAVRAAAVDVLAGREVEVDLEVDGRVGERLGIALADALPAARDTALARRRAAALLAHSSWRVRAAAIAGVERMRDPTLLADLVALLEVEPGRLKYDAWNALRRLTGKEIPPDAALWRKILPLAQLPEAGDRAGPGAVKGTTAYFGLPVYSRRIAFVFDVSGSMRDDRKIETAREQFRKTAARLQPKQRYDLFVYRFYLKYPPRPKLERCFGKLAAGKARKAAAWLEKQEAKGAGAIYDGLVAAMDDPEVDTIYLLSDGVPSFGTVKRDYRVLQEVRRRNRWRRVVIHTILMGKKGTDREFMERLAQAAGGVMTSR